MTHAIADGVAAAFVVAVPVIAPALGFAWLLRKEPLRTAAGMTALAAAPRRDQAIGSSGRE